MATKTATLLIKLQDQVSKGLSKIGQAFQWLKSHMIGVSIVVAAVGAALMKCFTEWGKQREAVAKLDTALANLEGAQEGASKRLQELATNLQKTTTFSDEAIISAEALLATYGLSEAAITKLIPRLLDVAARTGDLEGAAFAVGKAITTEGIGSLTRLGIVADEAKFKIDPLGATVDALKRKCDGMAEAIAKEPLGKLTQLKNVFGELMEKIGSLIAGPAVKFIDWLKDVVIHSTDSIDTIAEFTDKVVAKIMTELGKVAKEFPKIIPEEFKTILKENETGFEKFASKVVALTMLWGEVTRSVASFIMDTFKDLIENLNTFSEGFSLLFQLKFSEAFTAMRDSWVGTGQDIIENHKILIDSIIEDYNRLILKNEDLIASHDKVIKKGDEVVAKDKTAKQSLLSRQSTYNILSEAYDKTFAERQAARREKQKEDALATIDYIATMSTSKNATMAAIGKTSAIARATIDAHAAAVKALGVTIPPWNYILMAAVLAAGMAQVAQISAVKLAQGGIVLPRAGGVPAVLGEAGRAEAVIPLESAEAEEMLPRTETIIININGPSVTDRNSLREFAKEIGDEIWRLKKNKETLY